MAKATTKQKPSQLLPKGGDNWDITIKRLQAQMAEMTRILVDNILTKLPQIVEVGPSKGRSGGLKDPPRKARKEK